MTKIQEYAQCDGPWRPAPERLASIIESLPKQIEIRAVSINGQTGVITVECLHEGLELVHSFDQPKIERSATN